MSESGGVQVSLASLTFVVVGCSALRGPRGVHWGSDNGHAE
jgi:hypothetical protein